jgi:hypothetical protein
MAGLGPAIHDFFSSTCQIVDARPKAGHDEDLLQRPGQACARADEA